MERFENGSDMSGSRSLNNSTSKRVLNLLEPVKLTVWKVMLERVTVVKFRVNYGRGNGACCFEVKVWADTAKFTDVIVTRLRKCSDLIHARPECYSLQNSQPMDLTKQWGYAF